MLVIPVLYKKVHVWGCLNLARQAKILEMHFKSEVRHYLAMTTQDAPGQTGSSISPKEFGHVAERHRCHYIIISHTSIAELRASLHQLSSFIYSSTQREVFQSIPAY